MYIIHWNTTIVFSCYRKLLYGINEITVKVPSVFKLLIKEVRLLYRAQRLGLIDLSIWRVVVNEIVLVFCFLISLCLLFFLESKSREKICSAREFWVWILFCLILFLLIAPLDHVSFPWYSVVPYWTVSISVRKCEAWWGDLGKWHSESSVVKCQRGNEGL